MVALEPVRFSSFRSPFHPAGPSTRLISFPPSLPAALKTQYLPKGPSSSTSTPPPERTSQSAPKDADEEFGADERKRLLTDNQSLEEALAKIASENEALQAQLVRPPPF